MPKLCDLTGQVFGKLKVVERGNDYRYANGRREVMWICECDCGNRTIVRATGLKNKTTISCGCSRRDRVTSHGRSHTRLYMIFTSMKQRCYDNNAANHNNYGGRGIAICSEWLSDFTKFEKWSLENDYDENLSIDRIDVNGNYEPSNCRWVDNKTQSNNRRNNRKISFNGETLTVQQWADKLGIKSQTLFSRLNNGWKIERALSTDVSIR